MQGTKWSVGVKCVNRKLLPSFKPECQLSGLMDLNPLWRCNLEADSKCVAVRQQIEGVQETVNTEYSGFDFLFRENVNDHMVYQVSEFEYNLNPKQLTDISRKSSNRWYWIFGMGNRAV